jgi:putative ABC transport system ATP-binding protein
MLEAETHVAQRASGGAEVVVDHVSKTFGRVVAVSEASLRLEPGEFVALNGPSGCGKSTLLNMIGSLARPDSGTISVDGRPIASVSSMAAYRRATVGFVFQLHHLLPMLSAGSNVEVPLIGSRVGRRERRERARELLAEVGLAERVDHLPSQLSGGERQRVAVARALANRPRLLLADEPTGALDSTSGAELLGFMRRAVDEFGQTLVMVTHDPIAASYASRVVFLADGRIVSELAAPTSEEVLDHIKSLAV